MKFFITTAIDYTNAAPHIGHAYEKILADVIARYHRLEGSAFLLTGVDQHGQKVQQAAVKEGISPLQFAEKVTDKFLALWELLGISYDGWAATTDPRHERAVQQVLQDLFERDELYKASYSGFYSVGQEQFLTDKDRNANDEFDPKWGEVIFFEEQNWYFRLTKHAEWLRKMVENRADFVFPAFRRTELLNAIERIGSDLCVSRPKERLSWGIEFPFDPDFVTYVWFDALLNYVTFAGYLAKPETGLPEFNQLWPCQAHVIGKDILVPAHGVYWPIMLHAMGFSDDAMPRLAVHGWWNVGGAKMSKSIGNVVDPGMLAKVYGPDALRYYLMREMAFGQDADFSLERLLIRYNTDLANDLGNLINRSINMSQRYRGGILRKSAITDPDVLKLQQTASSVIQRYHAAFAEFQVQAALESVWELVAHANAFVERMAPWKMAKDPAEAERLDETLYALAEASRLLAWLISPVVPTSARKILEQLRATELGSLEWGNLPQGHVLGPPTPVFPRLDPPPASA